MISPDAKPFSRYERMMVIDDGSSYLFFYRVNSDFMTNNCLLQLSLHGQVVFIMSWLEKEQFIVQTRIEKTR